MPGGSVREMARAIPSRATRGSDVTGDPEPPYGGCSFSRIRLTRIRSAPGVESNISARAS